MTAKPILRILGVLLLLITIILGHIYGGAKYKDGNLHAKYLREDFGLLAWSLEFEPPVMSKNVQVHLTVTVDGTSHNVAVLKFESVAAQSTNLIFVSLQGKEAVIRFGDITSRGTLPFDVSAATVQVHNLGGLGERAEPNEFILLNDSDDSLRVKFLFEK
ncbi:MAG: hypothetical protein ACSHX7_07730 [Luteolibacter sp.]